MGCEVCVWEVAGSPGEEGDVRDDSRGGLELRQLSFSLMMGS